MRRGTIVARGDAADGVAGIEAAYLADEAAAAPTGGAADEAPAGPSEVDLLTEIRDELKRR
jgi:hypothetical protein